MTTLLAWLTKVCNEIGLPVPSQAIGSSDNSMRTLLTMSNREGRDLVREVQWEALTRLYTFTTVSGQGEYDLPSDFDRLIVDTEWDRSGTQPLIGPFGPSSWQSFKSGVGAAASVGRRFRIYRSQTSTGRKIYIDPVPADDGATLAFEYVSNCWCLNANGVTLQTEWATDTDTPLLNEDLLALGTIVRFRRSKGLAFASEADEYASLLASLKGSDKPAKRLDMGGGGEDFRLLDTCNIPDTGYGS